MHEVYTCVENWAWLCPNSPFCDSLLNSTVLRPWKEVLCSSTLHHSWAVKISCSVRFLVFLTICSAVLFMWILVVITTWCECWWHASWATWRNPERKTTEGEGLKPLLNLKGRDSCSTQKMEITDFCKTLVPINQTTWCHIVEDHYINSNYCDSLGCHRVHNNM